MPYAPNWEQQEKERERRKNGFKCEVTIILIISLFNALAVQHHKWSLFFRSPCFHFELITFSALRGDEIVQLIQRQTMGCMAGVSPQAGARNFSIFHRVQIGSGARTASCSMGTGGLFSGH
jgi:hypothetical protein